MGGNDNLTQQTKIALAAFADLIMFVVAFAILIINCAEFMDEHDKFRQSVPLTLVLLVIIIFILIAVAPHIWSYIMAIILFIISIILLSHLIFTIYTMMMEYEENKEIFYVNQWNEAMNVNDRYDYAMSYWQRQYFRQIHIKEIDDLIYEYYFDDMDEPMEIDSFATDSDSFLP